MGHRYAILGSGRQGTAAAYDLAVNGDADSVVLADLNAAAAKNSARRVNTLSGGNAAKAAKVDVTERASVLSSLKGVDVLVSAVPYRFNLQLARWAVAAKASMVDLGGNTAIVRKELAFDAAARRAGVAIVPDCGMGPGANITLAVYAIGLLDAPSAVHIYDGGLPQKPRPPWNYEMLFHVEGLVNEYTGTSTFLREGRRVEVPALTELEEVAFAPLGRLEALVTSGGLSTMPWTYEGKLRTLENKTLRYPGHWARVKAFADLGLFSEKPVAIGGKKVVPRDVFEALFVPCATSDDPRDVAVTRVVCKGEKGGRRAEAVVELVDWHDEATGFRAMERVTGWHASIVAAMIARGEIPPGAHSVEKGVPPKRFVEEARRRGLAITTRVT
ncbi:MAG TPA: saccharopine dehydrogenase C-terminal domain-containing protein [Thermoplasmata archaeon]|nr:saccharopine dehydrogenase C-terminal domain-containing protein [Thermoplasmata archaeon]